MKHAAAFNQKDLKGTVTERYLDTKNGRNKYENGNFILWHFDVCWKEAKVSPSRGTRSPFFHGVGTPSAIVRVRDYQRVQQHGMTGSLILPRGDCMPPNGITPPPGNCSWMCRYTRDNGCTSISRWRDESIVQLKSKIVLWKQSLRKFPTDLSP